MHMYFVLIHCLAQTGIKKTHASASSPTKIPSSCHHFSRYDRHDACSQLSVFANTELLRPEDRVKVLAMFGRACSILFGQNGGLLKWGYLQIIHLNGIFHYKPSIFGYPHLWKPPHDCAVRSPSHQTQQTATKSGCGGRATSPAQGEGSFK